MSGTAVLSTALCHLFVHPRTALFIISEVKHMNRIIRTCPKCGNNKIYAVSDRRHTCSIYLCCPACGHTAKPAGNKDYNEALRQAIVNWNLSAPLERPFLSMSAVE